MTSAGRMLDDCGLTSLRARTTVERIERTHGNGLRLIHRCGFRDRAHVRGALARVAEDSRRRALMMRVAGDRMWPRESSN